MDLLKGLNLQQQQAVMANTGPVLVLAGPGSGKTRVLTHRIAYLIETMGVRPYNILAVTFTNKAALEMESRVVQLLGESAQGLTLGTFHATCARVLRREAEHLPFNANFVIYDADDQLDLVKRALEDLNVDDKKFRPQSVHASISNAKNELLTPDDFPIQNYRDEVVSRIYRRYQEMLLINNALDFDDLLLWMAYLLDKYPVVRKKYARRFEHILVDEFQDTNLAQYNLVKYLSSFHHNLFVVGDTDQSIYRWRGADYRNVLRFEQDFPDAQVILLEQNYRSTQSILDVAMAVIDRHPYRTPKRLFTERGGGDKVTLHETYDDGEEADYVLQTIGKSIAAKEAKPGDFAIMYRTNAQSRILEEAFLQTGLPYKLVGAQRFYGRREVKDIIAYLRLVNNPNDEVSLLRVINVPPRGIGNKTVIGLRTQAKAAGITPGELLLKLAGGLELKGEITLTGRIASILSHFGGLLVDWRALIPELAPLQLMDAVLQGIDYRAYIDDDSEEGHERWDNILELRRLAAEFQEQGLDAFLERVALVSDQDTLVEGSNVPTLLTLHAAKGLEFPVVFIVGLNDGTLPHSRSFEDPEAMHEERRLLYVGITRAKDRLYLVYPQTRRAFGYAEPAEPSRYLEDIPAKIIETRIPRIIGKGLLPLARSNGRWQSPASASTPLLQARFHPGMRVDHHFWGEGMVLNSRLEDDDEIVDIFFEGVGLKRVAASLAKLEVKP
jgi:DNA helicase-2/ATP-dependent DNA helicase PcrA